MKQKPIQISVVAIFNKDKPPYPHMFKLNERKYYVDYIAETFEATSEEGEYYVYRCKSNFGVRPAH